MKGSSYTRIYRYMFIRMGIVKFKCIFEFEGTRIQRFRDQTALRDRYMARINYLFVCGCGNGIRLVAL